MITYIDPNTELPQNLAELYSDRTIRVMGQARFIDGVVQTQGLKIICSSTHGGDECVASVPNANYPLDVGESYWVQLYRNESDTSPPTKYASGEQPKQKRDFIQLFYRTESHVVCVDSFLIYGPNFTRLGYGIGQYTYNAIVGDDDHATHTNLQDAIDSSPEDGAVLIKKMCYVETTIDTNNKAIKLVFMGSGTGLISADADVAIRIQADNCQIIGSGVIQGFQTGVVLNGFQGTRIEMDFLSNVANIDFGYTTDCPSLGSDYTLHGSAGLTESSHIEVSHAHSLLTRWSSYTERWEPVYTAGINDTGVLFLGNDTSDNAFGIDVIDENGDSFARFKWGEDKFSQLLDGTTDNLTEAMRVQLTDTGKEGMTPGDVSFYNKRINLNYGGDAESGGQAGVYFIEDGEMDASTSLPGESGKTIGFVRASEDRKSIHLKAPGNPYTGELTPTESGGFAGMVPIGSILAIGNTSVWNLPTEDGERDGFALCNGRSWPSLSKIVGGSRPILNDERFLMGSYGTINGINYGTTVGVEKSGGTNTPASKSYAAVNNILTLNVQNIPLHSHYLSPHRHKMIHSHTLSIQDHDSVPSMNHTHSFYHVHSWSCKQERVSSTDTRFCTMPGARSAKISSTGVPHGSRIQEKPSEVLYSNKLSGWSAGQEAESELLTRKSRSYRGFARENGRYDPRCIVIRPQSLSRVTAREVSMGAFGKTTYYDQHTRIGAAWEDSGTVKTGTVGYSASAIDSTPILGKSTAFKQSSESGDRWGWETQNDIYSAIEDRWQPTYYSSFQPGAPSEDNHRSFYTVEYPGMTSRWGAYNTPQVGSKIVQNEDATLWYDQDVSHQYYTAGAINDTGMLLHNTGSGQGSPQALKHPASTADENQQHATDVSSGRGGEFLTNPNADPTITKTPPIADGTHGTPTQTFYDYDRTRFSMPELGVNVQATQASNSSIPMDIRPKYLSVAFVIRIY